MSQHPSYIIFAGLNGTGKSTFYRSGLWKTEGTPSRMLRVNPDEILAEKGLDWSDPRDQRQAGKAALAMIESALSRKASFNQETTLSGRLSLKTMQRARDLGYHLTLYYLGVQSAECAQQRIAHRVTTGGHHIDPQLVERRYTASLRSLSSAVRLCDQAFVIDNTAAFKHIAEWNRGTLAWWGVSPLCGSWLLDAITDDSVWAG